jgi:prepilin-type N-terminal cleavage/methylation domain-containing protein
MRTKAFSLIELLMVMAVGLMVMVMAVPAFTKLARKSKVQQAAETLITAFNMANTASMQLNRPEAVVVYFGDDFSTVKNKPQGYIDAQHPGILPKYGNIEIWTASQWRGPFGGGPQYPFAYPLEPVTSDSFTFPDGIRIIAGHVKCGDGYDMYYKLYLGGRCIFEFTNLDRTPTPSGRLSEIKRHCIATLSGSGSVQQNSLDYSYSDVLVFDVMTGEHVVISATGAADYESTYRFRDHKAKIHTHRDTHENIQLGSLINSLGWQDVSQDKRLIPLNIDK